MSTCAQGHSVLNKKNTTKQVFRFSLNPDEPLRLAELCGQFDQHLTQIEERLKVTIRHRGNNFTVTGDESDADAAVTLLKHLFQQTGKNELLSPDTVHLFLQKSFIESIGESDEVQISLRTRKGLITPRGPNQKNYVKSILLRDINFGIGPAGTGKTYLAVAAAVQALEEERASRIVLVRPAVEAGEKLGFLPGDFYEKINPYLRPLYDALYEMLGFDRVDRLIEKNIIEIAPLAYMRGRTLNNSFIILDESQNTTQEQMKMFLTRTGFGSTVVITGDITQVDLPKNVRSGLANAIDVLGDIDSVGFTWFSDKDIVRHPMVQTIVQAYERYDRMSHDQSKESSSGAGKSYSLSDSHCFIESSASKGAQ